jgi:hypothetical protein
MRPPHSGQTVVARADRAPQLQQTARTGSFAPHKHRIPL